MDKISSAIFKIEKALDSKVCKNLSEYIELSCKQKATLLKDGKDIIAIMCFAFTHGIPKDIGELDLMSKDAFIQATHRAGIQGNTAIAYTVWSKKKGGGKRIVQEVFKMVKKSNHLNRLVTLSPLTDMARKFHLRNGAKELQVNKTSQNFEYTIENEWWENYLKQAKNWFTLKR